MMSQLKLKLITASISLVGLIANAEARTVHVAVPTLSMVVIAFTAAKEKGYYRDEGLDVNLVQMRDTLGISALLGSNADFASMSGAGLTAMLGGAPLRFAFSSYFRPMFWLYAKPEFADVKALRGKRIGVTGLGSGPDNLLREVLKRNGIEGGRDATILALGLPGTLAGALRNGVVDAGMISPPFNFVVRDAGFRDLVSFLKDDFVELQGSILAHDKLFQTEPATVEKFVRGTVKGLRYARENKAGTLPILLRYMKIKDDLAGQYYDQVRPIMTADGTVSIDMQRRYLDQALKVLNSKEPPSVERIYNYSIARKVNAELDATGWKPGK
jgi:NitT/TauT family transport system substrate-binding protein